MTAPIVLDPFQLLSIQVASQFLQRIPPAHWRHLQLWQRNKWIRGLDLCSYPTIGWKQITYRSCTWACDLVSWRGNCHQCTGRKQICQSTVWLHQRQELQVEGHSRWLPILHCPFPAVSYLLLSFPRSQSRPNQCQRYRRRGLLPKLCKRKGTGESVICGSIHHSLPATKNIASPSFRHRHPPSVTTGRILTPDDLFTPPIAIETSR